MMMCYKNLVDTDELFRNVVNFMMCMARFICIHFTDSNSICVPADRLLVAGSHGARGHRGGRCTPSPAAAGAGVPAGVHVPAERVARGTAPDSWEQCV